MVEAAERQRMRQHVVAAAGVLALHALLLIALLHRAAPDLHQSAPALVTVDLSLREKPAELQSKPKAEPKPVRTSQPVRRQQPIIPKPIAPHPAVAAPAATTPSAPAAAAPPSAATATSDALTASNAAREDYSAKLQAWLAAHKRYPVQARRMRLEGSALLQLRVGPEGQVVAHRIEQSTGSVILDREVEAMLARSEPLPAPPANLAGGNPEFHFLIHFDLGEFD
ncbi:TonB family protein [Parvibaculum sp.]|uniref:energy transducer TonB n=1 Tax=Parvibaculum sp. TaxID=2024848 RepID=UPI00320CD502